MKGTIFLNELAGKGRYWFSTREITEKLGVTRHNANRILRKLESDGYIARPVRGFSVIIPPEYRRLKCLPPDELSLCLMEYWGIPYYVGLLSAAEYHGVAPQRPQIFQIIIPANIKSISCGAVKLSFIARNNALDIPVKTIKSRRGFLRVSTPEATAFDLVVYNDRVGGLSGVAEILNELLPTLTGAELVIAAQYSPLICAQRLGYLLDEVGAEETAERLYQYVKPKIKNYELLLWSASTSGRKNERWHLIINAHY